MTGRPPSDADHVDPLTPIAHQISFDHSSTSDSAPETYPPAQAVSNAAEIFRINTGILGDTNKETTSKEPVAPPESLATSVADSIPVQPTALLDIETALAWTQSPERIPGNDGNGGCGGFLRRFFPAPPVALFAPLDDPHVALWAARKENETLRTALANEKAKNLNLAGSSHQFLENSERGLGKSVHGSGNETAGGRTMSSSTNAVLQDYQTLKADPALLYLELERKNMELVKTQRQLAMTNKELCNTKRKLDCSLDLLKIEKRARRFTTIALLYSCGYEVDAQAICIYLIGKAIYATEKSFIREEGKEEYNMDLVRGAVKSACADLARLGMEDKYVTHTLFGEDQVKAWKHFIARSAPSIDESSFFQQIETACGKTIIHEKVVGAIHWFLKQKECGVL